MLREEKRTRPIKNRSRFVSSCVLMSRDTRARVYHFTYVVIAFKQLRADPSSSKQFRSLGVRPFLPRTLRSRRARRDRRPTTTDVTRTARRRTRRPRHRHRRSFCARSAVETSPSRAPRVPSGTEATKWAGNRRV